MQTAHVKIFFIEFLLPQTTQLLQMFSFCVRFTFVKYNTWHHKHHLR